jgi:hypothetical protein
MQRGRVRASLRQGITTDSSGDSGWGTGEENVSEELAAEEILIKTADL